MGGCPCVMTHNRCDARAPNPMVGEKYRRLTSDGEALTAC